MLNLNTEDINSIGNTIGTLIFFIIIIIGIIIIIDEIFNISKLCFKYTYLYNYGKFNENICRKDNNNLIEFETARYRIHNELNKYKLEKDLFNKNWINYVIIVSILLMSILMCLAFGYLFYNIFIITDNSCDETEDISKQSFLNKVLKCFGLFTKNTNIPNCSYNYFILFSIIFIYPLILILKFLVNVDYSFESNGIYTKLFHFFILINLLYYLYLLVYMKNDDDYWNLTNIGIYLSFIIVFYIVNIIFNKSYSEYYNINKGTNIYSHDKTLIGILNKYFHFSNDNVNYNNDDFRDINFFEIYKQQEPIKPKEFEKPDGLELFKRCSAEDFNEIKNTYCNSFKDKQEEYKKIKEKVDNYYQQKKQYEKDYNTYNLKYNIYKNNKIEFPEFVSISNHMIPKLLGFNKITHIILFISLLIFLFYYNYLKTNNKQKEANYIYNTIIIYIICLLSILVLSNSVLTYNTYVNKYLIYEPISYYKEDLFNMDLLFNALLNKDSDKTISNDYINLYNKISSKKISNFNSNPEQQLSLEKIIKSITGSNSAITDILNNSLDGVLNKLRCQILRILFSDLLKVDITFKLDTNDENILINARTNYFYATNSNIYNNYIINTTNLIANIPNAGEVGTLINSLKTAKSATTLDQSSINSAKTNLDNKIKDLRTFFLIIKNIFVEDKREFDKHIQKLKNNLKTLIYGDTTKIIDASDTSYNTNLSFYNNFLLNDVSNEDLLKIDNTKNNEYTKLYLHNLNYINMIFDYYKEFLMEFRSLIIDLFNSTMIECEDKDNVININSKLNHYISKIFKDKDFDFNRDIKNLNFDYDTNETKINIYKKILQNKIDNFNIIFRKYFNIIKAIYRKGFEITDISSSNKLEYNIINNYNFFNKDTTKHLSKHLLKYFIIINNENKNKYDNYDSEKILKLNLSINNISWSFVILMIIIAIFLIEPIIIQS